MTEQAASGEHPGDANVANAADNAQDTTAPDETVKAEPDKAPEPDPNALTGQNPDKRAGVEGVTVPYGDGTDQRAEQDKAGITPGE